MVYLDRERIPKKIVRIHSRLIIVLKDVLASKPTHTVEKRKINGITVFEITDAKSGWFV
jgi:hypothetical protein